MAEPSQHQGADRSASRQDGRQSPNSPRGHTEQPPRQPRGQGHPPPQGLDYLEMPISTRGEIPDRTIVESLGIVRGNSVRARNLGRDITQSLRNLIGGELKAYSNLMNDTRDQALGRMIDDAAALGADGVVEVRFETSQITKGGAELLAYGTAVRFE